MEALWRTFDREREYYLDKIRTLEQELEAVKQITPKKSVSTAVVGTVDVPSSEEEKGGESHLPVTRGESGDGVSASLSDGESEVEPSRGDLSGSPSTSIESAHAVTLEPVVVMPPGKEHAAPCRSTARVDSAEGCSQPTKGTEVTTADSAGVVSTSTTSSCTSTRSLVHSGESGLIQSVAKFIQAQTDMMAAQTKAMAAQTLPLYPISVERETWWGRTVLIAG